MNTPLARGLGLLRGAVGRFTTPLLPDDYLNLINPLWTAREVRGRILAVRRETGDAATLVIKPGWGFDFDYRPGQYIGIGIRVDGRWHWRSYSLTSPPERGRRTISIAVKAMPEGFLSSHLVAGVPAGTVVRLASPAGDFLLPDPPPRRMLFLTAGSGITPVLAMLRSLDRRARPGGRAGVVAQQFPDVVHVHSARTDAEVMFAGELAALAGRHPGYRYHLQLTRRDGKFALSRLEELTPDWRGRETWACGPVAMLDEVEREWRHNGIGSRLHIERFELERTAAGSGGVVTFGQSMRSVAADGATTLLQAGESVGVAVPFGCRMGICRTCVVKLTEGEAVDLRTGERHVTGDTVQTCVCAAVGDCTLDC